MIIAMPILGSEISPRFDCARAILLANVTKGKVLDWRIVEMKETNPLHRAKILSTWKVQQVICGGIDDFCLRMLGALRIRVSPWVSGNAHEALEGFLGNMETRSDGEEE